MCFAPAFGDEEESMGEINERCGGIDKGKRFLFCCVLTGAAHEEPRSQTGVSIPQWPIWCVCVIGLQRKGLRT